MLSTVTVTPAETRIMSTEALLSKTVLVKIHTEAHVYDLAFRGVHEHPAGLKRDFDYSRKKWTIGSGPLLCQRIWRRREEMACKQKRIDISLVFVTIMLHVLMYVVSNKLFWN